MSMQFIAFVKTTMKKKTYKITINTDGKKSVNSVTALLNIHIKLIF